MILARLLAPDQFGLMALVLASIGLFETFTEVGVRQSVIQNKQGDSDDFLNVAWWFSSIRGLLLYLTGVLAAPWVAAFYEEPSLTPLLRVAFLMMLLQGLNNPRLYVLEKHLTFGRYIWIIQGAAVAGGLVSLAMALWIPSVWALVAGLVTQSIWRCVTSFALCRFRVSLRVDRHSWSELFRFSRRMAGVPLLTYLFMQVDIFVLGKMTSKEQLGFYSMALALASVPQVLFSRVAAPMVLPVLSDSQDSMESLRCRLLRMSRMIFLFGLPTATCLALFARPILMTVYGSQYGQVGVAFSFLSYYVLMYVSGVVIASVYTALGRPDVHRSFTFARVVLMALFIYPAIRWYGPAGAAGARLACMVLAGIIQQINLSRLIQLPVRQYLATMKDGLVVSAVLVAPGVVVRIAFENRFVLTAVALGLCVAAWGYILWTRRNSVRQWWPGGGALATTGK